VPHHLDGDVRIAHPRPLEEINEVEARSLLYAPSGGAGARSRGRHTEVPAYWELGVGRGSVPQAEAFIAAVDAEAAEQQ
jgi:hypothetical protein